MFNKNITYSINCICDVNPPFLIVPPPFRNLPPFYTKFFNLPFSTFSKISTPWGDDTMICMRNVKNIHGKTWKMKWYFILHQLLFKGKETTNFEILKKYEADIIFTYHWSIGVEQSKGLKVLEVGIRILTMLI